MSNFTLANAATLAAQTKDVWVHYTFDYVADGNESGYIVIVNPGGATETGFDLALPEVKQVIEGLVAGRPVLGTPILLLGEVLFLPDAINLSGGHPEFGTPALSIGQVSDLVLTDWTLEHGLSTLDTDCDRIYVCSAQPIDFDDAIDKALGYNDFGVGGAWNSIGNWSDGRSISSNAIISGTIDANGTVTCWAAVDSANSRLLALGALDGGGAVSSGQNFSLDAITIEVPHALS